MKRQAWARSWGKKFEDVLLLKEKKKKTNDYWSSILIPGILNYPTDGYGTGTKTEI